MHFHKLQQGKIKSYFKCPSERFFPPLSLCSKKKVTAVTAAVTENRPPINEKTNSFRNTKFGTQIAFSMKMCKMPSSKVKDQWGPRWLHP